MASHHTLCPIHAAGAKQNLPAIGALGTHARTHAHTRTRTCACQCTVLIGDTGGPSQSGRLRKRTGAASPAQTPRATSSPTQASGKCPPPHPQPLPQSSLIPQVLQVIMQNHRQLLCKFQILGHVEIPEVKCEAHTCGGLSVCQRSGTAPGAHGYYSVPNRRPVTGKRPGWVLGGLARAPHVGNRVPNKRPGCHRRRDEQPSMQCMSNNTRNNDS